MNNESRKKLHRTYHKALKFLFIKQSCQTPTSIKSCHERSPKWLLCVATTRTVLSLFCSFPLKMSDNEEFPLKNKQAAITINGVHTEILLTGFADKIFVVITQYGKIGSLVSKSVDYFCMRIDRVVY